jgi:hypothetical protein
MLEILQNFEKVATRFSPLILVGPGVAAIIVGLFVWLGGLGFTRLLVALVSAIVGGLCGFLLIGRNIASAVLCAGLAGLGAIIIPRIFIALLAALLAAVVGFAVLSKPYAHKTKIALPGTAQIANDGTVIGIRQSLETARLYATDFADSIRELFSQMPLLNWAIVAAIAVVFVVSGFFLWRLASAFCSAVLGTTLVFAGMILLLIYKGSAPILRISNRAPFYAAVFAAMTAFGTIEQLLICYHIKRRWARKKQAARDGQGPERRKQNWRTT